MGPMFQLTCFGEAADPDRVAHLEHHSNQLLLPHHTEAHDELKPELREGNTSNIDCHDGQVAALTLKPIASLPVSPTMLMKPSRKGPKSCAPANSSMSAKQMPRYPGVCDERRLD